MEALVAVIAVTGTLMSSGLALAFDMRPPNSDYEARERSERLHVQHGWFPGDARASAPRRAINEKRTKQRVSPAPATTYDPGRTGDW